MKSPRPASQSAPKTVRDLSLLGREWLAKKGIDSARLDAELLIGHALGMTRLELYLNLDRPVNQSEVAECRALLLRRASHEPVAYIRGEREFYGHTFFVDNNVLVPRPDTETLIEKTLEIMAGKALDVLDLGTGSGCIALTLALENKQSRVVASDKSEGALSVARRNVERHDLKERCTLLQSDWFESIDGRFDVIVSNPPYVKPESELEKTVREFEPGLALFGTGENALDAYREILGKAAEHLKPQGVVIFEIGFDQGQAMRELKAPSFEPCELFKDLAHHDRVCVFRLKSDAGE